MAKVDFMNKLFSIVRKELEEIRKKELEKFSEVLK